MKIYGRPEFILNFYKFMFPFIEDIDIDKAFPSLKIHFVIPEEMPVGGVNSSRPHYNLNTKEIWLPIVEIDDIELSVYFSAFARIFAHELGHYVHFKYLPNQKYDDHLWNQWSLLTGCKLNFDLIWYSPVTGRLYPHVPSQEDFADDFSYTLMGERPFKHKQFYYNLWGQEPMRRKIEMWVGKSIAIVNGKEVPIDPENASVTPILMNKRVLLPIRFIAENMGWKVDWDNNEKKVTLIE